MALTTVVYDVTGLVGNQGTDAEADRADGLVVLVTRTVKAETWFALGGVGTVRAYFNPVKKKWFLSVYSDEQTEVKAALDALAV